MKKIIIAMALLFGLSSMVQAATVTWEHDGQNDATVDAVEIATNGTGLYYGSDTTITGPNIENGHLLYLDFDDTDAPAMVKITIYGYYDSNVN